MRLNTQAFLTCSRVATLLQSLQMSSAAPVTAVAWRASTARSQNILLAASGNSIRGLHVSTGKHVSTANLPSSSEHGDENILSMATSPSGCHVATGGSQGSVQLFDNRGADLQHCLQFGNSLSSSSQLASEAGHGHTNRVFALHWHATDENVLFSGGWDNTVQVRPGVRSELEGAVKATTVVLWVDRPPAFSLWRGTPRTAPTKSVPRRRHAPFLAFPMQWIQVAEVPERSLWLRRSGTSECAALCAPSSAPIFAATPYHRLAQAL